MKKVVTFGEMLRLSPPEHLRFSQTVSRFVTGIVIPVDGGFSSFSGV
ncbi:hypothetical protein [Autumnicola musiva]|uniref:Uncharacterized protein n=1 Tax=Autumnicola musiva TaxID=3075589 RepID=A0ABU3D6M4_9FLAO|nr:hypothetical protein [Zunongwangia sp. F117]MDT0677186.1 hypothetical protein [Zunongwangia sp. F117]